MSQQVCPVYVEQPAINSHDIEHPVASGSKSLTIRLQQGHLSSLDGNNLLQ